MKEELEKLLDTCVLSYLETWEGNTESVFFAEDVRAVMKSYAIIMCEKQREICAENATTETDTSSSYVYTSVDTNSIINSPLPKELQ